MIGSEVGFSGFAPEPQLKLSAPSASRLGTARTRPHLSAPARTRPKLMNF